MNKTNLLLVLCAIIGASVTWYLNHTMDYGAFIANGLVGVVAAILLKPQYAATTYIASFVGMSSTAVLQTMPIAALAGGLVGFVILTSKEVYAGIGGKGGTISTIAVQITKTIFSFFK